jgi:hypothetical protein
MKYIRAPFTKREGRNLFLTFLLLLTLPVFVFSLLQTKSFDFRNLAFEDIEVSEENPCVITFPNVNPYSLEINKTFRVQVDTLSKDFGIKSLSVSDNMGTTFISKEYTDNPQNVSEYFLFTPTKAISYSITGVMIDASGQSYSCVISSPYSVQGIKAITSNSKPVFTSTPKSSKPSQSIQVGTTYEYIIEAEDIDGDTINYTYSFTKDETWLKSTVIDDGSDGRLTIKLQGSTNKPGSYLANIFIHDGYSQHLSSQTWVISVSPEGNDTPVVTIIEPINSVVMDTNEPLKITWEANDSNQIVRYEIYISSNPANENAWIELNGNIPVSQTSYSFDPTDIDDGTYRIIVRAVDNQTPAAIGMDISKEIIISREDDDDDVDDRVILPEPQIINVLPTSNASIDNTTPTIKASLVSSEDTTINEGSIQLKLDNVDITEKIKINKISDSEYTIIYVPEEPLEKGMHKVYVTLEDSNGTKAEKDWTFTIGQEDEDTNSFNIFGLKISKTTLFIITGGIFLIFLAIMIPILVVKIWKKKPEYSIQENPILPKSIPPVSEIPQTTQETKIEEMVKENFEAPEPELNTELEKFDNIQESNPINTQEEIFQAPEPEIVEENKEKTLTPTPPEPEQDLSSLYNQIKSLEDTNGNNGNNNSPQ